MVSAKNKRRENNMKYILVLMSLMLLLGINGCDDQEYDQEVRKEQRH